MRKRNFIPVLISLVAMALPAAAASERNPITPQQIAAAINGAGLKISADQVVLLSDVVARTSDPALKVESMERWDDRRLRVRLQCAKAEECLPFFVAVSWGQAAAGQPALADLSSTAISQGKTGSNSFVVRAGSPAILLIEGAHIHIQLQVVCLENGVPGQTIRATSQDRRQTYTAKVGEDAVLRGKL